MSEATRLLIALQQGDAKATEKLLPPAAGCFQPLRRYALRITGEHEPDAPLHQLGHGSHRHSVCRGRSGDK